MALDPSYFFYSEGTITVTNGSDIATGNFTAWDPAVLPFDFVYPNDGTAGMSVIKEVLAMDQIQLAKPWTGPTLTDVPYFMVRWTRHTDPRIYALRVSDYLTKLKGIPDNIEEAAAQIAEDAASVAAAMPVLQAAVDAVPLVDADRQAAQAAAVAALADANRAASYVPTSVSKSVSGLVPFNDATAPTTTIGISPGSARDKNNNIDIVLAAAMRKRLDQPWAAGNGNGGLDTGTMTGGIGYHIHLIRNPITSAVDVLLSTSATNPTMPAGFTQRRRVGGLMTAGAPAYIEQGYWYADGRFRFVTPVYAIGGVTMTPNPNYRAVFAPAGIKLLAAYGITLTNAAAGSPGSFLRVSDPDIGVPNTDHTGMAAQLFKVAGGVAAGVVEEYTNAAGFWYLTTEPATATVFGWALGWTDLRDGNE